MSWNFKCKIREMFRKVVVRKHLFVISILTIICCNNSYAQNNWVYVSFQLNGEHVHLVPQKTKLYKVNAHEVLEQSDYRLSGDSLYFIINSKRIEDNIVVLGFETGRYFVLTDSILLSNNEINFIEINIDTKPFNKDDFSDKIDWETTKTIYSITHGIRVVTLVNRPIHRKKYKKLFSHL